METKIRKIKTKLLLLAIVVLITTWVFWDISQTQAIGTFEYTAATFLGLVISYAVYRSIKNIREIKAGLTIQDEFSHQVKIKAAAKAFQFSIFIWAFLALYSNHNSIRGEELVVTGLIAMILLNVVFWLHYSQKGGQHED